MTRKQDFLRKEQSRDLHPERVQVGSPAVAAAKAEQEEAKLDRQEPGQGKLKNDRNKMGHQEPTQLNQGQRSRESRNDRQSIGPGSHNQVSLRKSGGGGAGGGPARGAG